MLNKLHPKLEDSLRFPNHGTIIDGAFATEAIDTSGEVINIKGADISSLNEDGVLNSEHINPDNKNFSDKPSDSAGQWGTIVGRIIFAKKIFSEQDCESERELKIWRSLQLPFIYGGAELFDAEGHQNARELAAIFKHYHNKGLPVVVRYSIEGSTVERQGNYLNKTIARRVAITQKPCNKSSISNIVALPDEITKGEKDISVSSMQYDPVIELEDPIIGLIEGLKAVKELNKALDLGSANVAPGSLTGGAVLAKNPIEEHRQYKMLKNQAMAALRDWNKAEDFKTFLKHRLPDASEKFIEKYSDMVSQYYLGKTESKLQPVNDEIEFDQKPLSKLPSSSGGKKFKGKTVKPGEAELIAGPFQGSKLQLMGTDDNYAYVIPFKAGDEKEVKVNKLNRKAEGIHFKINKQHEILDEPNYVDGNKHSDPLNVSHEQRELIHGIDLSKEAHSKPMSSTEARAKNDQVYGWYKSLEGKNGLVKPGIEYGEDYAKKGEEHHISTARREVVFHNLAHSFFGVGDYIPTTALFSHPDTGEEHSVMEQIPDAAHTVPKSKMHHGNEILDAAGANGDIHKLAMVDAIMGMSDRNRFNYMVSPQDSKVKLVDNARIFDYRGFWHPSYLLDHHKINDLSMEEDRMHPNAVNWLVSLDPMKLHQEMTKNGIHGSIIKNAVQRLIDMQSKVVLGNRNVGSVIYK